ncbi:MAG TPA: VCBS repeat-containing protein [Planctomycetota bacterium]|nr:VCBS repeat-containing protein [Planctomycetota bacterium]
MRPDEATIVVSLTSDAATRGDLSVEVGPAADSLAPATVAPAGSAPTPSGVVPGLESTPRGAVHRIRWNAENDVGAGFRRVLVRVSTDTASAERLVPVGNDAPVISDVDVTPIGDGDVEISFVLADSAADPTSVDVRFSTVLDAGAPSSAPNLASPASQVPTSEAGTAHSVVWHAGDQLGLVDRRVRLMLTPRDFIAGTEALTGTPESQVVELDLNVAPGVQLVEASSLGGPTAHDTRRLELVATDPESDPVDLFIQWTHPDEDFPEIPEELTHDPAARRAALADPATREALHIVSARPRVLTGVVARPAEPLAPDEILLPWIQTDEALLGLSGLVPARGNRGRAAGLRGATLRLIRADDSTAAATICSYDPQRAVVTLDPPLDPPATPGDRVEIERPALLEVASGPGGLVHHLIWETTDDLPGGGEVRLRAVPFDTATALATGPCRPAVSVPLENAIAGDRGEIHLPAGTAIVRGPFGADTAQLSLPSTDEPQVVDVVDLDADGLLDIVIASEGLLAFLQQSERGFFDPWRFFDARLGTPTAMEVADLDGDGDLDVAIASDESANLLIFFQESGFNFVTNRLELSGFGSFDAPIDLIARDLDGDGDTDIAVLDGSTMAPGLFVLYRDGGAAPPCTAIDIAGYDACFIASSATRLAAGDLDQDGALDIVTINDAGLTIRFGDAGGFDVRTLAVELPGTGARPFAVADLDGDGTPEIISTDADGAIAVARREAESYVVEIRDPGPQVTAPSDLIAADIDADDSVDVIIADRGPAGGGSAGVLVAISNANGGFAGRMLREPGGEATAPRSIALGDIDGDGLTDIAAVDPGASSVTIFHQVAAGSFRAAPQVIAAAGIIANPEDLVAGDFDGDGRIDLLTQSPATSEGRFFFQNASREFTPQAVTLQSTSPFALAGGDVDGDGRPDLVSADVDGGTITIQLQNASGAFTAPIVLDAVGVLEGPEGIALGDLDGDGRVDVVVTARVGGGAALFRQNGTGSFGGAEPLPGTDALGILVAPVVADLDQDGHADVIALGHDAGTVYIWLGMEGGGFSAPEQVLISPVAAPVDVALADLDGDGELELAVASLGSVPLAVIDRAAGGAFSSRTISTGLAGANATSVAAGDLNGDGRPDLVLGNADEVEGSLFIFMNPAEGQIGADAPREIELDGPASPIKIVVGDLDGDGATDIAVADRDQSRVLVFRGGE